MKNKPFLEVGYEKWWHRFWPPYRTRRKILQAFLNAHEVEFKKGIVKQCSELMLYGCSMTPIEEFYGKSLLDEFKALNS